MTTVPQVTWLFQNESDCDKHTPPSSRTLLLIGYSILMPIGVILNGVSLFVFLRWLRPLSVVGTFLCNLALSDLLFSLSLPLRIYYYANNHWPFGPFLCRLSGSIFHINMYGSCLFLFCINVDRYLAIVHPLRFRHLRRRRVARLTCLCVWLVIIGGSVPAALVHNSSDCWNGHENVPRCFEGLSSWGGFLLSLLLVAEVIGFLLPLSAVLYGSSHVFWELCRAPEGGAHRHQKTIRLLVLNLSIFLFCFVPYNSTLVGYGLLRAELVPDWWNAKAALKRTLSITVLLASTNCALDPLVYYFSTEGFRKTISQIVRSSKTPPGKGKDSKAMGGSKTMADGKAMGDGKTEGGSKTMGNGKAMADGKAMEGGLTRDRSSKRFGITTGSSKDCRDGERWPSRNHMEATNGSEKRRMMEESEI